MADQTLQSFLVRLGFLVDPAGQKRFQDSLTGAARQVNELRLGLVALAIGVEEAVRRTTRAFDQLFYASTSLHESAQNINKLRDEFAGATGDATKADQALAAVDKNIRERGRAQAEAIAQANNFVFTTNLSFIEGIGKAYYDAVKKSGSEFSAEALRIRREVEAMGIDFDGQIRAYALNFDLAQENAAKMSKIYKALGLDTKDAWADYSKRARDMDIMFTDLGKTFQTAFSVILLNPDISKAINEIAEGLGKWLVSEGTQKEVAGILKSISDTLKDEKAMHEFSEAMKLLGDAILAVAHAAGWLIETLGGKTLVTILLGYAGLRVGIAVLRPFATAIWGIAGAIRGVSAALALIPAGGVAGKILGTGGKLLGGLGLGLGAYEGLERSKADIETHEKTTGHGWFRSMLEEYLGFNFEERYKKYHQGEPGAGYQHGGIVSASLHPGEMVLPRQISEGLQQLFMRPTYGGFANDNQMADQIDRWLSGDTSFKPIVDLADQTFEKLRNLFLDFFPEAAAPGAAPGAPGGAGQGVPGGPGGGAQPGPPTRADPRGMIPVIRAAAIAAGVDPDIAVRVARSEGLTDFFGDRGTSGGAFQLHRGGGLGDEFQKETGLDPLDPKNEVATIEWAMKKVKQTGWAPWHGAARIGVGQREGLDYVPREAPGGGAARFSAGGVNLGRVNQALVETLTAASKYLPEGYRVEATSGEREGGLPGSQHHGGQALDVRIIDSEGKPIPNKAPLGSAPGLYATLAHGWYQEVAKRHPELRNAAAWGGEFETSPGSGKADWMHFDFGKRRGRFTRGDWAYTDSSTTTVVVNGVTDPHGSGRAVTDRLDRRSAQHMRNFRTNVA